MKKNFFALVFFLVIALNLKGQALEWGRVAYENSIGEGAGVATDNFGNLYGVGWFRGQFIIGSDTLFTPLSNQNFVITKHNRTGDFIWAKSGGGNLSEFVSGITTLPNGNVVISGYTLSDTFYFQNDTLINLAFPEKGSFLISLDSSGNLLWMKADCIQGFNYTTDVVTDTNGNIYLSGIFFSPEFSFYPDTIYNYTVDGNPDTYLAKFNIAGNLVWLRSYGGNRYDRINRIAVNNSGDIFITGRYTSDTLFLDSSYIIRTPGGYAYTEYFIARLNSSGNSVWIKGASGIRHEEGICISVDNSDNIYAGGIFSSPKVIFGTDTLTNLSDSTLDNDFFIARYNFSGNIVWVKQGKGHNDEKIYDSDIDPWGYVYFSGGYSYNDTASLIIDSLIIAPPDSSNAPGFIILLDSIGNIMCHQIINGAGDDILGIATNKFGDLLVSGDLEVSPMIFGNDTLIFSPNVESYFVAAMKQCVQCGSFASIAQGNFTALPSDGTYQWINCDDNNSVIAGATNQTFIPTSIGNYAVIVTYNGCIDTTDCKLYSGMNETDFSNGISFYPSPFTSIATIEYQTTQSGKSTVTVENCLGQIILSTEITNNKKQNIDMSNSASGMYFIKCYDGKQQTVVKIVKN